jgi:hypothetical protein
MLLGICFLLLNSSGRFVFISRSHKSRIRPLFSLSSYFLFHLVLLYSPSQIFYSIMDLTLFGEQASKPMDTISTVADLRRKHTSWKCAEGAHWHTRFTHLINYGAGKFSGWPCLHSLLLIDIYI